MVNKIIRVFFFGNFFNDIIITVYRGTDDNMKPTVFSDVNHSIHFNQPNHSVANVRCEILEALKVTEKKQLIG